MKQTIADALTRKGYETLTPVQHAVTQPELEGRDMLVSAQTGSGKTIGFGLAIAPTLLAEDDHFAPAAAPLALVIAPTRELAMQVKRELGWLFAEAGATLASCVGGMDPRDERRALARGAHIVVATPGRLRDHLMRGAIDLSALRAVVLDEADEMLDLGFREDLEFILDATPATRQTLLFSATVPPAIAGLAQGYQRDAERISTISTASQHSDITYRAMAVAPHDAEAAIINVLRYYEAPNAIVFCNTRAMVARLTARLSNRGFAVVALSGELTQGERSNALQSMRDGRARVCVATDVAARGIDLPNLDLVVHAELPGSHEALLHRSGRTGRAGRKGISALVVVPAARNKAERLLKFARLSASWGPAPAADEVIARDRDRMLASDDWAAPPTESERPAIDALIGHFTPEQLATAYLRQYSARHSAPEELTPVQDAPARPRGRFGPSVWFSISDGRNPQISPRSLLPMLCKAGRVSRDDIGAIRLGKEASYVELRASAAEGFIAALGPEMMIEKTKQVTRLAGAPDPSDLLAGKPRRSAPGKSPHRKGRAPTPKNAPAEAPRAKGKPTDAPRTQAPKAPETPKADRPGKAGKPPAKKQKGTDSPAAPKGRSKGKPPGKAGTAKGKHSGAKTRVKAGKGANATLKRRPR